MPYKELKNGSHRDRESAREKRFHDNEGMDYDESGELDQKV